MDELNRISITMDIELEEYGELLPPIDKSRKRLVYAVINLTMSAIGVGVIGLPFSVSKTGVINGGFALILFAFISFISAYYIASISFFYASNTYQGLAEKLYGPKFSLLVSLAVFAMGYSECVSYLIIIRDILLTLVRNITLSYVLFGIVNAGIIFPLICYKRIQSLGFTSSLAFIALILFVLSVALNYVWAEIDGNTIMRARKGHIVLYSFNIRSFMALGIFMFAYSINVNVPTIMSEVPMIKTKFFSKDNKPILKLLGGTYAICFVLYSIVAFSGYATFFDNTKGDIIKSFSILHDEQAIFMFAVRCFLGVSFIFTFPVIFYPTKKAFYTICSHTYSLMNITKSYELSKRGVTIRDRFGLAILFISIIATSVAIPSLSWVLEIGGFTSALATTFVFPIAFWIKSRKDYTLISAK